MPIVAPLMPPPLAEVTLGAIDLSGRGKGLEPAPAPGPSADFQVPKGCVVRNTFLEWAEEDGSGRGAGALPCPHEPSSPSSQRRPRSCPPEPDGARRLIEQSTADEEASAADEEPPSGAAPCATPDRGRGPRGEEAAGLGGAASAETPPPPVLPGVVERRGSAALVAENLECDDDGGFNYRIVKHRNAPQDTQPWQGRSSQTAGGYRAGAAAVESHAHQRTPKSATAKESQNRSSMMLRGLPFDATEADVVAFINQHGAADALATAEPVCLVANPQGKPSGFAEVHLNSHASYADVQGKLHMQRLGDRYIEVLHPSGRGKASPWKSPAHRGSRWSDGNRRDVWRQM